MSDLVAYVATAVALLALILILAMWFSLYLPSRAPRRDRSVAEAVGARERVDQAVTDALSACGYTVGRDTQPSLRLGESARFAPTIYMDGAGELARRLRQRSVVSLDVRRLNRSDAARLIDFCSGLISATDGWIFQVAEGVLVLVPGEV